MPEDLIILRHWWTCRDSMLHLLMLHGNPLPEAWKFVASIPKMADATLENGKSMHSHM